MGFWPFGGGGKRQRVVEAQDHARDTLLQQPHSDRTSQNEKAAQSAQSPQTNKLSRRDDTSRKDLMSRTQYAATVSEKSRRASRTNSQYTEKHIYQQNPLSQSSLGPENFTAVFSPPTLHAKRSDDSHLPRRKSSKRKAEDFAREREIKAMSSSPIPIPKRSAASYGSGPLQRDNRQIPGALNRRFERPASEVSLPMPDSITDLDSNVNQNSFKVGMLAALSPRPTIKYDNNPRHSSGKQPSRQNTAIQRAIAEEDTSDLKRINELADDLDANGLRELMERDRRRREKKKESDKLKLQRKLQRRAERQREEEARRARTEAFVRDSPIETQHTGMDVDLPENRPRTANKQDVTKSLGAQEEDPFADNVGPSTTLSPVQIRNPFEDEKDMEVMETTHDDEEEEGEAEREAEKKSIKHPESWARSIEDVRPHHEPSQHTTSPPVSPIHRAADRSSISQGSASLIGREITPDIPENAQLERRISEQSSQRLSSWTTFFKRGTRRKYTTPSQGRTTPSEFSNTSRESVQRNPPPSVAASRTFRRSDSAVPQRTMSRFREDLPELPMSPPDSRIQSPETTVPSPSTTRLKDNGGMSKTQGGASALVNTQVTLPQTVPASQPGIVSPKRSVDLEGLGPGPGPVILSQSLASVDSEGSWLSGRPPKRLSGTTHGPQSVSSVRQPMPGAFDQRAEYGDEEAGVVNDDYYSRLSPASPERRTSGTNTERKASSTLIDLQRERHESDVPAVPQLPVMIDELRHGNVGQKATLVQQAGRAKSKEGLLKEYNAGEVGGSDSDNDDDVDVQDIATPDAEIKDTPLLRARSIEYKGHARQISAGSAKLLDIKRSSIASDTSRPKSQSFVRKPDTLLQDTTSSKTDATGA